VNEELQKNSFRVIHATFYAKTRTGKKSFKQARISPGHFYMRHILAAKNFLDLAQETWQAEHS